MPKISVVLPVFNGERFLKYSIESVLKQTFKDWELIIVDDCSTDNSNQIIEEYASKDERIVMIRNSVNMKLPESLNIGFRLARGKYFCWTSDDNVYLNEAFETMVNYLDCNPDICMVCTGMLRINEDNKVIRENIPYDADDMCIGNAVGASFMYRREVYDVIGEYDNDMFCVEDYDYWMRILTSGRIIKYLTGCYYLYREHENSLTSTKSQTIKSQHVKVLFKYLDWIMDHLSTDNERLMILYNKMIGPETDNFKYLNGLFKEYIPELLGNTRFYPEKKYIVYGAGNVGRKCAKLLGDRVICFADKYLDKGSIVDDIKVIKPEDMQRILLDDDYGVIIALGYDKQLTAIKELHSIGITNYTLMAQIQ